MYLKNKEISIVGAGLVGSLLSIYFKQQGAKVSVFEKRSDMRLVQDIAGRSINLALSDRGIKALKIVGLHQEIMDISMPMYKRIMHFNNGNTTEQYYGKKKQAIYSVSRRGLNSKLIDIAESKGVNFTFNQACNYVDVNTTQLNFKNNTSFYSDFIFGADGAGSMVRKTLSKFSNDITVQEHFINHGYKELTIPSNIDGSHKLENNALHIWPRKSHMIIALPNLDGTFTCTLFLPMKGEYSFASIINKSNVNKFFSTQFKDLKPLLSNLIDQYFQNPVSSLGFVRCNRWKKNNTFLIGDACHATVPFYGQGMNAGFEDCYLLDCWINKHHDFNKKSINNFLKQRIIDTAAMQDLSMNNFIEMRDKTADPNFLLQKKIEKWFSDKNPNKWIPLYSMVTFSDIGYHQAMKRGIYQDKIMKSIMTENKLYINFDIVELEAKNVEEKILDKLNAYLL